MGDFQNSERSNENDGDVEIVYHPFCDVTFRMGIPLLSYLLGNVFGFDQDQTLGKELLKYWIQNRNGSKWTCNRC